MSKNVVAKTWSILPSFDGLLYSQYPLGDKPVPAQTGGPKIAFTDIVAGKTSNGEFNRGDYLSIFGWGFGTQAGLGVTTKVYIGGVEVDNYRALNPAPTFPRNGLQRIIVQVGPIGGAAAGSVNAIKVTVGGIDSNTNNTFTVQPGDVYFAALNGNDATGVKNDITKPYRYVQQANGGTTFTGIWATMQPGDTIVIRGGNWSDQVGFEGKWVRFQVQTGNAPTGVVGHGYYHITAYPGPILGHAMEDVHMTVPAGGAGGIHGCSNAQASLSHGRYWTVSNLRIECNATVVSDAAPIDWQAGADNCRAVGNNCGPWPSTISAPNAKAGGIAGEGRNSVILGNYCHDIACGGGAQENHGIYMGDASPGCAQNVEVAYNWCQNITGGSGIQTNNTAAGDTFTGLKFHHNFIENTAKSGIVLGTSTQSCDTWDNVIYGAAANDIRHTNLAANPTINHCHNTLYQTGSVSAYKNVIVGEDTVNTGTIKIQHNIIVIGAGSALTDFVSVSGSAWTLSQNLYYDYNLTISKPGSDALGVQGDPKFTSLSGLDFTVLAGGAGLAACTTAENIAVSDDYLGTARPVPDTSAPGTTKNDIGAMQGVGT